jgi:anti-sigma regulatory factor (Ser/Thr protein kinase)
VSTAALDAFVKKYQTARDYNSKDIRLTLNDAEELALAIAEILANVNRLSEKVIDLQDKLLQDKSEINLSGGKF